MKLKLSVLALSLFTACAFAATDPTPSTGPSTPEATTTAAPNTAQLSADTSDQVPMNKYGAVNANAKVPLSVQITPSPANFTQPSFTVAADTWKASVPTPPALPVNSYVLMTSSGNVLAAFNANQRVAPASLTKMMLMYVVEKDLATGAIHVDDKMTVPTEAWATGGSRMFLKPNQKVNVQDLVSGVIVASGNDAAVTLAVNIAGSQQAFVKIMNDEAQNLGMTNTHFATVMGLPAPNQYTTAYDMALLAKAIITQYPQYYSWYSQKSFSFGGISQPNFNKLLFIYPYATGLKTGSTAAAGFSLVSSAQMPNNPMVLIGAVMGAQNGNTCALNSKALLSWGFKYFTTQTLYKAGSTAGTAPVANGEPADMPVTVAQDLTVIYPSPMAGKLQAELKANANLTAPISKGTVIGNIVVTANGQTIAEVPAIAAQDENVASLWQRVKRKISG